MALYLAKGLLYRGGQTTIYRSICDKHAIIPASLRAKLAHFCKYSLGGVWNSGHPMQIELSGFRNGADLYKVSLPESIPITNGQERTLLMHVYDGRSIPSIHTLRALAKSNLGPSVKSASEEERIETFLLTKELKYSDFVDGSFIEVAKRLATFHLMKVPRVDMTIQWLGHKFLLRSEKDDATPSHKLFTKSVPRIDPSRDWLGYSINEGLQRAQYFLESPEAQTHQNWTSEIKSLNIDRLLRTIQDDIKQARSPLVFCHNSLCLPNIRQATNGKPHTNLIFVGTEHATTNYRAFDLADIILQLAYEHREENDSAPTYIKERKEKTDWIFPFLRAYLLTYMKSPLVNETVVRLYDEVDRFIPVVHLLRALQAIGKCNTISENSVQEAYLEYACQRLKASAGMNDDAGTDDDGTAINFHVYFKKPSRTEVVNGNNLNASMVATLALYVACIVYGVSVTFVDARCPYQYEWYATGGYCYKFYETCETWDDARTACQAEGADLIMLRDATERDAFIQILKAKYSGGATPCPGWQAVWVGATDKATEGTWKWVNGTSASISLWAPREPNNSNNEDCLFLAGKNNEWKYHDADCTKTGHKSAYVCASQA